MITYVHDVRSPVPELDARPNPVAPFRLFVWAGAPPHPAVPAAGVRIDGLSLRDTVVPRLPGLPVQVEAGAAIAENNSLEVDALGRVIPFVAGVIVARALEAAAQAGDRAWVVLV